MVKEKETKSAKAAAPAPTRSGGGSFRQKLFMVIVIMLGAAFLPVSTVLGVGLLPTFAAFMTDPTRQKTRSFTIGLLNFVTCFPFAMEVALENPTMDGAVMTITDPLNIVIMFAGAAAGYFIDWTLGGISNVIMTGRARQRLDAIERRQKELVRRFGQEVTGQIPVDPDGFPLVQGGEE